MKGITVILFSLLIVNSFAQRNYRFGVGYSVGISTFYSTATDGNNQLLNSNYGLKSNQGGVLKFEMDLSNRWDLFFQTGFQQRGVKFKNYLDSYDPRYRLNYWDVNLGIQFLLKTLGTQNELYTTIGLSQLTLISAKRVYDTGKDDINDDFNKLDLGASFGIGYKMPIFQTNCLQLQITTNVGFKQLYTAMLYENGMRGRNVLLNVHVNYLF